MSLKAFLAAAGRGNTDLVREVLLSKAWSVSDTDGARATVLHRACGGGSLDTVRCLIEEFNANLSARDSTYKTPLMYAAAEGHLAVVSYILTADASAVGCHKTNSWTPLMFACKGGHVEVVKVLLQAGANVHDTTKEGATALYVGAREGSLTCVEELLRAGADFAAATLNGRTPLHCSVMNAHLNVAELLLARGADPSCQDSAGVSVFHEAAQMGDVQVLDLFARHGFRVTDDVARDVVGRHPLHAAALNGHCAFVNRLLEDGVSVDLRDSSGATSLYYAASKGNEAMTGLLLSKGADPNTQTQRRSALCGAVSWGHSVTVCQLVAAGADPACVDADGQDAWSLAKGKPEMLDALKKALVE